MKPFIVFTSLLALCLNAQERQFPTWRPAVKTLNALWETSPIIAVGDVENISDFGVQTAEHLPVAQDLHQLYWCQADFRVIAIIKGGEISKLPKKYVWGSVNPGCRLFYGSKAAYEKNQTRVWFLREDGLFLRPESDGSALFYGLLTKWNVTSSDSAREQLGSLLLTPQANVEGIVDYSDVLWHVADFACSLLGKEKCVERIDALSRLGYPKLRETACQYLKAQQGEICKLP